MVTYYINITKVFQIFITLPVPYLYRNLYTNMESIKKRGCNYTPHEKSVLLVLVNKYKDILENKETTSTMINKKRETWIEVARQYNAVSSSGIRTWLQLRHLYENIKQRLKKNISKEINAEGLIKEMNSHKENSSQEDEMICPNNLSNSNISGEHFMDNNSSASLHNSFVSTQLREYSQQPTSANKTTHKRNLKVHLLKRIRKHEEHLYQMKLKHMEEKRNEEKEIFELKKMKLLLQIDSLQNKKE